MCVPVVACKCCLSPEDRAKWWTVQSGVSPDWLKHSVSPDWLKHPLRRFFEIFKALSAERSWCEDIPSLRFSAVTVLTCQGTPAQVTGSLRAIAEKSKHARVVSAT